MIKSINLLEDNGILYICYPKLKNTINVEGIHRDHIFPYLHVSEETGYVGDTLMRFNKMASFDKDYTLLGTKKDVKRQKRHQDKTDYSLYIQNLKENLTSHALVFYNTLPKGYQTNWARYVYSAKQQKTKDRRLKETNELLEQHIKTK
ncbi:MAG: YdeI/OmpD-associated family protein [Acholeplasmataceae bacterium]